MSQYLMRLVGRARGSAPSVKPNLPSRFTDAHIEWGEIAGERLQETSESRPTQIEVEFLPDAKTSPTVAPSIAQPEEGARRESEPGSDTRPPSVQAERLLPVQTPAELSTNTSTTPRSSVSPVKPTTSRQDQPAAPTLPNNVEASSNLPTNESVSDGPQSPTEETQTTTVPLTVPPTEAPQDGSQASDQFQQVSHPRPSVQPAPIPVPIHKRSVERSGEPIPQTALLMPRQHPVTPLAGLPKPPKHATQEVKPGVSISIGKIEIKQPSRPTAPQPAKPLGPSLDLATYLKDRSGGRS